jgi:predicted RNase H-like HicB family nuclease
MEFFSLVMIPAIDLPAQPGNNAPKPNGIYCPAPSVAAISMRPLKVIIEKHVDGYIAYPLGLRGVVIGQGETYDEALCDVTSAIGFYRDTFGDDAFDDNEVLEVCTTEVTL